jgi:hypothetical protein
MKTNTQRIKSLKDRGFKVNIEHYRLDINRKMKRHSRKRRTIPSNKISSKGGQTLMRVIPPQGEAIEYGAFCNPKDGFSYRLGTTIALNRIEQELNKKG